MVYEANARVRDPVYGCVGAISSLQNQIDVLQTQLALAQAEVVHLRVRQTASLSSHGFGPASPSNSGSPSSKLVASQTKPIYDMDLAHYEESMWTCQLATFIFYKRILYIQIYLEFSFSFFSFALITGSLLYFYTGLWVFVMIIINCILYIN